MLLRSRRGLVQQPLRAFLRLTKASPLPRPTTRTGSLDTLGFGIFGPGHLITMGRGAREVGVHSRLTAIQGHRREGGQIWGFGVGENGGRMRSCVGKLVRHPVFLEVALGIPGPAHYQLDGWDDQRNQTMEYAPVYYRRR